MPIATLGVRRLYDALGVGTSFVGEIFHKVTLKAGRTVSVYIGPKPPLGIVSLESNQYVIPGRESLMLKTNSKYDAPSFLEITIGVPREITLQTIELLRQEDKVTQEALLKEADDHLESAEHLLDVISGILGLRVHRQLVLKPLVENCFIAGEFEPVSSFVGPAVEMLEGIESNANTGPHLKRLLEGITSVPEDSLLKGGSVLHWLLRAWRERDAVSKFMYLFVPLEAILQSITELEVDSKANLESLEAMVKSSNVHNREALLGFLDRAKTKFGPTLNARFEEFAYRAAIPGWELDVKAFKKFNRMRNLLLHAGDKNVRSHINFEENSRTLEDLVERYVSVVLLRTPDVYQSRWRPQRSTTS
ncbi:MAG: hypothetical protein AAB308_05015 [Nitrospirota bacterium]